MESHNHEPNMLRIHRLTKKPTIPTKGSRFAARYDVYAGENGVVLPGRQAMVEMGMAIGLPEGTYGRLAARSGLASKIGIEVGGCVIDADYSGEVQVILRNQGKADRLYKAGNLIV